MPQQSNSKPEITNTVIAAKQCTECYWAEGKAENCTPDRNGWVWGA